MLHIAEELGKAKDFDIAHCTMLGGLLEFFLTEQKP